MICGFSYSDKSSQIRYYYEQNKTDCTTKIQPLAVFTKKSGPFINRHFIDEPPCAARPGHSLMRQSTRNKPIVYIPESINQTAYAGIDTPQDGESVLHGPEHANSRMLTQLSAWKNFSLFEPYEPAVVTYIDQPSPPSSIANLLAIAGTASS